MKSGNNEKYIILMTLALVLILGVGTIASLWGGGSDEQVVVSNSSSRAPAGVLNVLLDPLTTKKGNENVPIVFNYTWNCKSKELSIPANANKLRLRIKNCLNTDEQVTIINNTTNGYESSVFMAAKNDYTTEYMDISPGENKLHIQILNSQQQSNSREIIVHRN